MAATRRSTHSRRPLWRRTTTLLLVPIVVTVAVAFALQPLWPNRPNELPLHHPGSAALKRHGAIPRSSSSKRALDYLLEAVQWEAPSYPEECRQRYNGLPFLQTINSSWQQPICSPQERGPLNSSLSCWFQFDQYAEAYCTGGNLALDLVKFAEEQSTLERMPSNRNEGGSIAYNHRPGLAGELLADCQLHGMVAGKHKWNESSFGKGGQEWLYRSFKSSEAEPHQPRCVAWVQHPTYFINDKYDSVNIWHALEDVSHAFEAYALKGWGREAQVVLLDQATPQKVLGTYLPIWRQAFSSVHPPTLLSQLAQEATAKAKAEYGGQLPPGAAICFKDVFFNVHGGISLLSRYIAGPTPCTNSTTVNAMVTFMLDALQLDHVLPASHSLLPLGSSLCDLQLQQPGGQQQLQLQPHTEQSGGQHQHQQRLEKAREGLLPGTGMRMRVVWALRSNRAGVQEQIVEALQQRIPREAAAEFVAVEFGGLSIEEQIHRARQADVLVGYHGAALTLSLFMPPESGLVEIEEEFRCACYTNCALWRNHPYSLIHATEYSNKDTLVETVVGEVKKILGEVASRLCSNIAAGGGSRQGHA